MQSKFGVSFVLFLFFCHWNMPALSEPLVQLKAAFVTDGKYDFVSLIKKKNSPDHLCTATLILKNLILTSASCIESAPLRDLEAVFITTDPRIPSRLISELSSSISYRKWAELKYYPNFIKNSDDLAVVTLKTEVTRIAPANLHLKRGVFRTQKNIRVIGWGQIQGDKFPLKASTGTLKLWEGKDCARQVNQLVGFDYTILGLLTRMFCASSKDDKRPVIVYDGDYGGPVVDYANRVIGIMISRCPVPTVCFTKLTDPNLLLSLHDFEDFLSDVMTTSLNLPNLLNNEVPS